MPGRKLASDTRVNGQRAQSTEHSALGDESGARAKLREAHLDQLLRFAAIHSDRRLGALAQVFFTSTVSTNGYIIIFIYSYSYSKLRARRQ